MVSVPKNYMRFIMLTRVQRNKHLRFVECQKYSYKNNMHDMVKLDIFKVYCYKTRQKNWNVSSNKYNNYHWSLGIIRWNVPELL